MSDIETLKLGDVCRIRLEPGEVLAIVPAEDWPAELWERVQDFLQQKLRTDETGAGVAIFPAGTQLHVVKSR